MKGKVVGIIIAVVAVIAVVGGVFAYNANKTPKYADDAFVKAVGKGLEARWELINANDKDKDATQSETDAVVKKGIQKELDSISKYSTANFKSTKLQELAVSYINALKVQKKTVTGADGSTTIEKFNEAYNKRTVIISTLVKDYGLTVSDKYQGDLDGILSNGKDVKKDQQTEEQLKALKDALNFQQLPSDNEYSDYRDYEAVLENTSNVDFDYFDVEVTLLDADGVNLNTAYANVSNWKQGSKARFEFSTDEDFASMELKVSWAVED